MKRTNVSAFVYLILVFVSGVVVGGVGLGFYNSRSAGPKSNPCSADAVRHRYIEEMRTRLKLTRDQIHRMDSIFDQTHQRFRALREKYKPEVKAIQEDQVQSIRTILDERQRAEFEKMRQERERERQKAR